MKFYRYDEIYGEYNLNVGIRKFKLVRETPKGYWITFDTTHFASWKKWIPKSSKKRYAYPTQAEALYSFIRRKQKQIQHCERDLRNAKQALAIAKEIKLEPFN